MANLALITVETDATAVLERMARGHFHSWQDGRWRYSPFGGETVYCNDPTERFPERAEFPGGYAAAAWPEHGLFARVWTDGSRRVKRWDSAVERDLARLYPAKHPGEQFMRDWLAQRMDSALVSREVCTHRVDDRGHEPGELLTMGDGSRWFHPYRGGTPQRL